MRRLPLGLLLLAALPACSRGAPPPAPPVLVVERLLPGGGEAPPAGPPRIRVEVAADPASRERGLMGREFLPPDGGMLFAYPEDRELGFWMKDCPIPLSAAFLDAGGVVLNVEEMGPGAGLREEDLRRYPSAGPARYVLEMGEGWFARRGIGPGDRIDVAPALRGVVVR